MNQHGVEKTFHATEDGFAVQYHSDDTPIVEANRALQNEDEGWSKDGTFKRVAHIPPGVLMEWIREDGAQIMQMPSQDFADYVKTKIARQGMTDLINHKATPYYKRAAGRTFSAADYARANR